jgi:hypothetical protein
MISVMPVPRNMNFTVLSSGILVPLFCTFKKADFIEKRTLQKCKVLFGDPDENRTRVTAVKGRCLNRLTTGPDGSGKWIRTIDTSGMNRML